MDFIDIVNHSGLFVQATAQIELSHADRVDVEGLFAGELVYPDHGILFV